MEKFAQEFELAIVNFVIGLHSLDHESTKIGPNFRKQTTSKNEVITKWFYFMYLITYTKTIIKMIKLIFDIEN